VGILQQDPLARDEALARLLREEVSDHGDRAGDEDDAQDAEEDGEDAHLLPQRRHVTVADRRHRHHRKVRAIDPVPVPAVGVPAVGGVTFVPPAGRVVDPLAAEERLVDEDRDHYEGHDPEHVLQ